MGKGKKSGLRSREKNVKIAGNAITGKGLYKVSDKLMKEIAEDKKAKGGKKGVVSVQAPIVPITKTYTTKAQAQAAGKKRIRYCERIWKDLVTQPLPSDDKYRFDNPNTFLDEFKKYLTWCAANPFISKDVIRVGHNAGAEITIRKIRPPLLQDFLVYIGMPMRAWKLRKTNEDFADVCEWIEMKISTHLVQGALLNEYNGKIAAALTSLVEVKEEVESKPMITINMPAGTSLPEAFMPKISNNNSNNNTEDVEIIE